MATYIILSRISSESFSEPANFRELAEDVSTKIGQECPGVTWLHSFATMGSFDVVDVVEADDPKQVGKAAMIIRSVARAETETLAAVPWKEFIDSL